MVENVHLREACFTWKHVICWRESRGGSEVRDGFAVYKRNTYQILKPHHHHKQQTMDLILSDFHPYDTSYSRATRGASPNPGPPIFIAKTGHFTGRKHVSIEHLEEGAIIAEIDVHFSLFGNSDTVIIRGRELRIVDHSMGWTWVPMLALSTRSWCVARVYRSVEFIAADGRVYKWELDSIFGRDMDVSTLLTFDRTKTAYRFLLSTQLEVEGRQVAIYDGGSRHLFSDNESPVLRIFPEVLHVLEDIVSTLAYATKRRELHKEASRAH